MSLPTFPSICPPLTMNESLNMILASIAMEELGLSHIINAEGEKLQYVLGTLDGGPDEKASVEEVLAVNKSVKSLLDSVMQNQVILKGKMECAVDALGGGGGPTGPAGPPGPAGPTGPSGSSGSCRAISFPGCSGQRWVSGTPLIWSRSECSRCRSLYLSSDNKKIILGKHKCYVVSFSVDLYVPACDADCVSIRVQTQDCDKKVCMFDCHVPVNNHRMRITASAGGIFVSTHGCSCLSELTLVLRSPDLVKVSQASICVMEI